MSSLSQVMTRRRFMNMTAGQVIRLLREQQKFAQGDIGGILGLSIAQVSLIENDRVKTPEIIQRNLRGICTAFKITPETFERMQCENFTLYTATKCTEGKIDETYCINFH